MSTSPANDLLITDASRFLAQSQLRQSFSQTEQTSSRNPLDRQRGDGGRAPSRGYLQRRPLGNPYQRSTPQASRFPFASRVSNTQAPLFYSATDDFREEDDGQEHDREVSDFYALQQSRRDFAAAPLSESDDDDGVQRSAGSRGRKQEQNEHGAVRFGGIRSSWNAEDNDTVDNDPSDGPRQSARRNAPPTSVASSVMSRGKDKLVDVELASTIREADELEDPLTATRDDEDDDPPSVQTFRKPADHQQSYRDSKLLQSETRSFVSGQRPLSPDTESVPAMTPNPQQKPQIFDSFWATLFVIDTMAMLATFLLVLLHTSAPSKNSTFGDTIYTTMTSSFHLLAVDTVVAIVVALVWISALKSFVRQLVWIILAGVPILALSFSLYPFISSYKGTWHGSSIQDQAMRYLSLAPAIFAVIWSYTAYKGRHQLDRAIELLEFSTRIVAACPTLVAVGFATLAVVVGWTWIWMLMFTRVFLGGHLSTSTHLFIINTSTWWLGIYFVLTYLWTLGVISGLQRATTAAATSQWYFYRNAQPAPPSQAVVRAAFSHATTKIFGTVCFGTLLSLGVRLPLLVLPARLSSWFGLCFYSLMPTSIATLTNPLTLTYAAIHSQPLMLSARGLSELTFVAPTSSRPTTALTPHAFSRAHTNNRGTPSLLAYRLAKLLLHATRFVTSVAFGFGGWVSTARMLAIAGSSARGSLYAYVVGLIAGAIGWAVLGAMEGVLGGVLDAVVVCWGSEMQSHGFGQARFCREAGELLADDGVVGL